MKGLVLAFLAFLLAAGAASAGNPPSASPAVPAGQPIPTAGQTCPQWVHDQYVTTGPDGKTYATWHPPRDAVWGCYFNHEHGSDPSLFSPRYRPAFGYSASLMSMSEPHAGFKDYVFADRHGHNWLILQHQGTSSMNRVCARFHTLDFGVADDASGEVLADLHLMGDFGPAVINSIYNHNPSQPEQAAIAPATCPTQYQDAAGSFGIREIPSQAAGSVLYEPWRADLHRTIVGLQPNSDPTFLNEDSAVICGDNSCNSSVATGQFGESRRLTLVSNFGVTARRAAATGHFQTDVMGTMLWPVPGMAMMGPVSQYIKPGFSAPVGSVDCVSSSPYQMAYSCFGGNTPDGSGSLNFESSLRVPN